MDTYVKTSAIKLLGYDEILAMEKTNPIKFNRLRTRLAKSMESKAVIAKAFNVRPEDLTQVIKDRGWKKSNRKCGRGSVDRL